MADSLPNGHDLNGHLSNGHAATARNTEKDKVLIIGAGDLCP